MKITLININYYYHSGDFSSILFWFVLGDVQSLLRYVKLRYYELVKLCCQMSTKQFKCKLSILNRFKRNLILFY